MNFRLIEFCASTFDVFLHEQQFLHSGQLLNICWPWKNSTEIIDRKPRFLVWPSSLLALRKEVIFPLLWFPHGTEDYKPHRWYILSISLPLHWLYHWMDCDHRRSHTSSSWLHGKFRESNEKGLLDARSLRKSPLRLDCLREPLALKLPAIELVVLSRI